MLTAARTDIHWSAIFQAVGGIATFLLLLATLVTVLLRRSQFDKKLEEDRRKFTLRQSYESLTALLALTFRLRTYVEKLGGKGLWDEAELLSTEEFQLKRAQMRVAGFAEIEKRLVELEVSVREFTNCRRNRNIFGISAGMFDREGRLFLEGRSPADKLAETPESEKERQEDRRSFDALQDFGERYASRVVDRCNKLDAEVIKALRLEAG